MLTSSRSAYGIIRPSFICHSLMGLKTRLLNTWTRERGQLPEVPSPLSPPRREIRQHIVNRFFCWTRWEGRGMFGERDRHFGFLIADWGLRTGKGRAINWHGAGRRAQRSRPTKNRWCFECQRGLENMRFCETNRIGKREITNGCCRAAGVWDARKIFSNPVRLE